MGLISNHDSIVWCADTTYVYHCATAISYGMKQSIHPQYYEANAKCACGNTWKVGSTLKEISVEICDKCHPFYTGKEKLIDTRGRIDKFKKRLIKSEETIKGKITKKPRIKKK